MLGNIFRFWPTLGGDVWGVQAYTIRQCVPRWRASATEYY
jgi:hypothetical protein